MDSLLTCICSCCPTWCRSSSLGDSRMVVVEMDIAITRDDPPKPPKMGFHFAKSKMPKT